MFAERHSWSERERRRGAVDGGTAVSAATELTRPGRRVRPGSTAARRFVVQLLGWLVILGLAALLAVGVLIPRLAGATPYTILTGSMRPHYPPGTMVVVRPVEASSIRIGDVVTYQLHSGEPEVVTHRVVAVGVSHDGQRLFRTQGDANNAPDADWVQPAQLRGRLWYAVPYLGRVTSWISGGQRQLLTDAIAGGLAAYAAWMFVSALRTRRRRSPDGVS